MGLKSSGAQGVKPVEAGGPLLFLMYSLRQFFANSRVHDLGQPGEKGPFTSVAEKASMESYRGLPT